MKTKAPASWSRNPPTDPGLYWFRTSDLDPFPGVVWIFGDGEDLHVFEHDCEGGIPIADWRGQWQKVSDPLR